MRSINTFIIPFMILVVTSCVQKVSAQAPPAIEPGRWILDTANSDEFNGSSLDTTKWWAVDICEKTGTVYHGFNAIDGAFFEAGNVTLSDGNLILKVDINPDSLSTSIPCHHVNPTYPFTSGALMSVETDAGPGIGYISRYSFGYYEINAKLPGYYDKDNNPVGLGFYPAFWISYQYRDTTCIIKHDEVDIFESSPEAYYDARSNWPSWHDEDGKCWFTQYGFNEIRCATPYFAAFHKFAALLLPDKIAFYLDDELKYYADTLTTPGIAHSLNMSPWLTVWMHLFMGGGITTARALPDAPFPEYMYIDYFRYYHLNPDSLNNNVLFQNSPNPFKNTVVFEYNTDNNSSSSSINIYDIIGRKIKSLPLTEKGRAKISFDGSGLSSGLYLYSLVVDDKIIDTKKMVVLK